MNIKSMVLIRLLVVYFTMITFLSCSMFSQGSREKNQGNTTKIVGKVRVYGNDPHTFVGIVDKNGTAYAVYPDAQQEQLRGLQGHEIEFTVVFLDEPKGYGSLFLKGGTVTPIKWLIMR